MPGLGKLPAAVHGGGLAGATNQILLPSKSPGSSGGTIWQGAESFRSGWQSLLASLDPVLDPSTPGDTDPKGASPASASEGSVDRPVGSPSTGLDAGTMPTLKSAGAGQSATPKPGRESLVSGRKSERVSKNEAFNGASSARSVKVLKPAVFATEGLAASTPLGIVGPPVPAPLSAIAGMAATNPESKAQPEEAETPRASFPASSSSDSDRYPFRFPESSTGGFNAASAAANNAATQAGIGGHGVEPPVRSVRSEGPIESTTQPVELNRDSAQKVVPAEIEIPEGATGPVATPTEVPNHNPSPSLSPSDEAAQAPAVAPTQQAKQTIAPTQDSQTLDAYPNSRQRESLAEQPIQVAPLTPDSTRGFASTPTGIDLVAVNLSPTQNVGQGATSTQGQAAELLPGKEMGQEGVPVLNPIVAVMPDRESEKLPEEESHPSPELDPLQAVATSQASLWSSAPSSGQSLILEGGKNVAGTLSPGRRSTVPVVTGQSSPPAGQPNPMLAVRPEQGQRLIESAEPVTVSPQAIHQNSDNVSASAADHSAKVTPSTAGDDLSLPLPVNGGTASAVSAQIAPTGSEVSAGMANSAVSNSRGIASKPVGRTPIKSAGAPEGSSSAPQASAGLEMQPTAPSLDPSGMARQLADARGGESFTGGAAGATRVAASGSDPREAFATLDSAGAPGKPVWIQAGAQRAEAGFQDPALGWVGVRAESAGGRVHAEVIAGSTDAAQALSGHLAGLNAFLDEHHNPVDTLTLTAPESRWSGQGSDADAGQNLQQGTGQQMGQQAGQGAENPSAFGSSQEASTSTSNASSSLFRENELDGSAPAAGPGGVHISVMA